MKTQETDFTRLESAAFPKSDRQKPSEFMLKLRQILKSFFESIFRVSEPKICVLSDKFGSTYWTVNDPLFGRKVFFNSETEVREWLDRRYYR